MPDEFYILRDEDNDKDYWCKDYEARQFINTLAGQRPLVLLMNSGGTVEVSGQNVNLFELRLSAQILSGSFHTYNNGSFVRAIFVNNNFITDYNLPILFRTYDERQNVLDWVNFPVYADGSKQVSMAGKYGRWSVLDFVFSSSENCFYLVGSAGEMNVQADWNQTNTSADDYIKNKPTIPAAQVNSDWNASSGVAQILNKPSLANVATSGEADDVFYDNTTSGLAATDVQDAIDEVVTDLSDKMDSVNPEGTGSFSMNRLAGSTIGTDSHAEGHRCTASGDRSHAEGSSTIAASDSQHVSGKFNIADPNGVYAEIIGNGIDENDRSNARELGWNGDEYLAGDLTINKGTANEMIVGQVLANKADASDLPSDSGYKDNFTDVSLASDTNWSTLASFNLTKGVWLVEIAAEFQNNNANFRGIGLYVGTSTPTSPSGIRYSNTIRAVDGAVTNMTMCMPIDINSDRTIYILGRQNSGTTLTTKPRACWVKIMPR